MLTPRETQILILSADGLSAREAAERLGSTVKTVQTHRHQIIHKLGARNMVHALALAYVRGLVGPATDNDVGRISGLQAEAEPATMAP